MAPPTWLPPLNSHHRHEFHIKLSAPTPKKHPRLPAPFFFIKTRVTVKFKSDESANQRILQGLSCTRKTIPILCSILDSPSFSTNIIKIMLDLFIPFNLSLINDELAEFILSSASTVLQRTCTECHNVLPLVLEFAKEVKVPDSEFEAWISWYDEKTRVDPDFERDYNEAIRRDRTVEELLDEATSVSNAAAAAAAKSCIEELEEVKAVDSSSENYCCLICLEELAVGSKATRLPCSHMFHGNCIVKWLQDSHTCPLCRFALPSA